MRNFKELEQAIALKYRIVWNDPEPIEDANYVVQQVFELDELKTFTDEELREVPILIHYGGSSEAEVFLSELVAEPILWVGYALHKDKSRTLIACYNQQDYINAIAAMKKDNYKYIPFTTETNANEWLAVKTW